MSELGKLVGGLNPEDLKSIPAEAYAGLTPEGMAAIPPEAVGVSILISSCLGNMIILVVIWSFNLSVTTVWY